MQKQILSVLVAAAVSATFNAGPVRAQTTQNPATGQTEKGKGERTGEVKTESPQAERKKGEVEMEARGAQKPGRMEKPGAEMPEAKESRGEAWATQDVKQVQEALKNKGYDPGSIDGVMGPQTLQAIRAFQKASGLKESARLDAETAKKLGVEKGTSSERRTSVGESTPKPKEPSSSTGK